MSKEEIDSMLKEADDNSDGYLDYEGEYSETLNFDNIIIINKFF